MPDWNYGNAYLRCPIEHGTAEFENGSKLQVSNVFSPLPDFMQQADLIFCDPPWNQGNIRSFYTKAGIYDAESDYGRFIDRLFDCIKKIHPATCYLEIGKEYLAVFITKMQEIYKYVTFYNSSYYHKNDNLCYIVRGSRKAKKPKLDGIDEEDIITWVCENESYTCIGDLCMGRGLVACAAYRSGKKFVGTELNHKRLSVALEHLKKLGGEYYVKA